MKVLVIKVARRKNIKPIFYISFDRKSLDWNTGCEITEDMFKTFITFGVDVTNDDENKIARALNYILEMYEINQDNIRKSINEDLFGLYIENKEKMLTRIKTLFWWYDKNPYYLGFKTPHVIPTEQNKGYKSIYTRKFIIENGQPLNIFDISYTYDKDHMPQYIRRHEKYIKNKS